MTTHEMYDLYQSGLPVQHIADKIGKSNKYVYLRFSTAGLSANRDRGIFSEQDKREMADEYAQGKSYETIATDRYCSPQSVRAALRGLVRSRRGATMRCDPAVFVADWNAGMSRDELAHKHGYGNTTSIFAVNRALRRQGWQIKARRRA